MLFIARAGGGAVSANSRTPDRLQLPAVRCVKSWYGVRYPAPSVNIARYSMWGDKAEKCGGEGERQRRKQRGVGSSFHSFEWDGGRGGGWGYHIYGVNTGSLEGTQRQGI